MKLKERAETTEPAGFVKKGEEPQWDKAKKAAAKYFKTDDLSGDQYALANYLFQKFSGRDCEFKKPKDIDDGKVEEAIASLANGPLMRSASHKKNKQECREQSFRFLEKKSEGGRDFYPCVIIAQGMGNLRDKNYYTADAIKSGEEIYEGKKAYYDHPTETEEQERPGRSVREIVGHYEDVKAVEGKDGLLELRAKFVPLSGREDVASLLEHAVEYKKKYPDKDFIGISINGDGEGVSMDYDEFIKEVQPSAKEMEKIKEVEGQSVNVITKLTEAVSADLVTEAGARGQLLKESKKQPLTNREKVMNLIENFRKLLLGIETDDVKLREEAVKDMLQSDDGDADDKKQKEAEEKKHEADSMAKHMLQAKKELKKEKKESEEEYEARCMKQAMERHEEEKKEKEKKEAADKKDGKDDGDADDQHEEKSEKKEAAPADKKDDGDSKDDGDDKDHADADQDKALIKKMMKQYEELKKEVAELKKGKEEAEADAKEARESAANVTITLKAKERSQLIGRVLGESGLPRFLQEETRPVLEKCKTEKEMREVATRLAEAHQKAVEEKFMWITSTGHVERAPDAAAADTDSLFLK